MEIFIIDFVLYKYTLNKTLTEMKLIENEIYLIYSLTLVFYPIFCQPH